MRSAVFLDRDGTLMVDVPYCREPGDVVILPGVRPGLRRLKQAGLALVVVTNQSGLGRGWFDETAFWRVQSRLEAELGPGLLDATYFCPDHPDRATVRRKPGPGMLWEAARDHGLDLPTSYLLGDQESDVEAGRRAGLRLSGLVFADRDEGDSGDGAFRAKTFATAVDRVLTDWQARAKTG